MVVNEATSSVQNKGSGDGVRFGNGLKRAAVASAAAVLLAAPTMAEAETDNWNWKDGDPVTLSNSNGDVTVKIGPSHESY